MKIVSVPILKNATMTGTVNSFGIDCCGQNQFALASIQAVWTGATAAGTLTLQISDDDVPVNPASTSGNADPAANVVNWSTYTGSSETVSGPGNFLWNMVFVGFRWVRLSYTASSGTGSLSATFSGKG